MERFNEMQRVKRAFFTYRNGALADNMRQQGATYRIIFGLNIPQLVQIASETPHSATLAQSLWENRSTRESMLLAPMIYPIEEFDIDTARRWADESPNTEVADILCHRLLRHTDYAQQLANELIASDCDITRYSALRLMFNLLPSQLQHTKDCATTERQRDCPLTASLCRALLSEIEFLTEEEDYS